MSGGVFRTHWMRALLYAEVPIIAVLFSLISDRDPTLPLVIGVFIGVLIYVGVRSGKVAVEEEGLKVGRQRISWDKIVKVEERQQRFMKKRDTWVGPYNHIIFVDDGEEERRISLPEVGQSDVFREELANHLTTAAFEVSRFEGTIGRKTMPPGPRSMPPSRRSMQPPTVDPDKE
jgi:hypothetical protein